MDDDEVGVEGSEVGEISVHAGDDVGHCFTDCDEESEDYVIILFTFCGSFEEVSVFFLLFVDFDETRACEELHDHAGCDDGGNAELHERSSVGGEDDSEPV